VVARATADDGGALHTNEGGHIANNGRDKRPEGSATVARSDARAKKTIRQISSTSALYDEPFAAVGGSSVALANGRRTSSTASASFHGRGGSKDGEGRGNKDSWLELHVEERLMRVEKT
jgi:hypothetical protein